MGCPGLIVEGCEKPAVLGKFSCLLGLFGEIKNLIGKLKKKLVEVWRCCSRSSPTGACLGEEQQVTAALLPTSTRMGPRG